MSIDLYFLYIKFLYIIPSRNNFLYFIIYVTPVYIMIFEIIKIFYIPSYIPGTCVPVFYIFLPVACRYRSVPSKVCVLLYVLCDVYRVQLCEHVYHTRMLHF